MTLRRKSREFALQMLFEWDMTHQDPERVERLFWKSAPAADQRANSPTNYSKERLLRPNRTTSWWRSCLRIGGSTAWRPLTAASCVSTIYELRSGTAPGKVVIDEALELAKKFSSAESPSFLNGVLNAAFKSLETQKSV